MLIADVPAEPRVVPSLKQAWVNMWPAFGWLLLFTLIAALAGQGMNLADFMPDTRLRLIFAASGFVLIFLLAAPLGVGVTKAHLVASRGGTPNWSDLGYAFSGGRYLQAVLLGVLVWLIVMAGLILLIVPGLYLVVRLALVTPRFIEDELSATQAIKAAFEDTRGRFWSVAGLVLMSLLVVVAGLLVFVVGIFVSIVLVEQMTVVYWRAVNEARRDVSPEPASPWAAE